MHTIEHGLDHRESAPNKSQIGNSNTNFSATASVYAGSESQQRAIKGKSVPKQRQGSNMRPPVLRSGRSISNSKNRPQYISAV